MKNKINVLEVGLKSDPNELQSKCFQSIIDQYANENNIIYFPKGTYVLSTIILKNNTHILIDKDAIILGAKSFYDYQMPEKYAYPLYQDCSHSNFNCSLFTGKNLTNITIEGLGTIDMRSVWDLDNVRDIVHRGPKCITLVQCNNALIKDLTILNVTDLAVYFVSSNNVVCDNLKLKVYIDGISPDNSKNVEIKNCNVEAGDDGVVFKSTYNLNKLDYCKDIYVHDCVIKSRCNAIKFGTETNGGFYNIKCENIKIYDCRITAISVESVDGAILDNIIFNNINISNVGTPFFVFVGDRLRGPKSTKVGSISNVTFTNIKLDGNYHLYDCMAYNFFSYIANDNKQWPGHFSKDQEKAPGTWQISNLIFGHKDSYIKNITFKNIDLMLDGGVNQKVNDFDLSKTSGYPEISMFGNIALPAYGFNFINVDGLTIDNVNNKLLHNDAREEYYFKNVTNQKIK